MRPVGWPPARWRRWLGLGAVVLCCVITPRGAAEAHGSVVNLGVTCATPDPGQPRVRRCIALLTYVDRDPVAGAAVQIVANREGKNEPPLGPIPLRATREEGTYAAPIAFPAYGTWRLQVRVLAPGKGEAVLREVILPPVLGTAATLTSAPRVRIILTLGRADVADIVLRTMHLLASISWFAATAVVWGLWLFGDLALRPDRVRTLARGYAGAGGGSFWLVIVTGIANAVYSTPARAPGVLAPAILAGLPFGRAYLTVFAVKMGLTLAVFSATLGLARELQESHGDRAPYDVTHLAAAGNPGNPRGHRVVWLAGSDLVLGLLIFAAAAVLLYLHVVVHVAAVAR